MPGIVFPAAITNWHAPILMSSTSLSWHCHHNFYSSWDIPLPGFLSSLWQWAWERSCQLPRACMDIDKTRTMKPDSPQLWSRHHIG